MLRISHDNKGSAAGWFLDDVTVDIPSRGDHVVFPCHRWLADDEDDGKIERELYPGQQIHTTASNCWFFFNICAVCTFRRGRGGGGGYMFDCCWSIS